MGIDISQFRETYFEESFEGLEIMERGLLELGQGEADPELVNEVFRAAHSIKGGAGTYGFEDVGQLTHVLETLLDCYRNGDLEVQQEALDAMLAAVDCVREMFDAAREDRNERPATFEEIIVSLEAMLGGSVDAEGPAAAKPASGSSAASDGVRVTFTPQQCLFETGNDPLRLFRCVADLGELDVQVQDDKLPRWSDFDPETCYVSWQLEVHGDVAEQPVLEVFDWVTDVAEITAEPLTLAVEPESGAAPTPAADEPSTAAPEKAAAPASRKGGADAGSIRVNIDKVDSLINMVGELVITQSMLSQVGQSFDESAITRLRDGLVQLERNTRELQESVMRIRMVPMSFVFGRIPRVLHDVAGKLGKRVRLDVSGEQTELDKTVLERIYDPLVHIVRNSLDHGLETPDERAQTGKPEVGCISLHAYHHGGNIVIEVSDDGRGLDVEKIRKKCVERGLLSEGETLLPEQAAEMVMHPGFSTADEVTEVSGRGVGMDVVKANVDELGGSIAIESEHGKGTTITIRLPLTLAILDGQTVCVGEEKYILPLNSIVETIQVGAGDVSLLARGAEVFRLRDEYMRVLRLAELFGIEGARREITDGLLVVVESGREKIGLFVDELLAQQQIVIKSLETNYSRVEGVSGATILGDGRVALILDVAGLIRIAMSRKPAVVSSNEEHAGGEEHSNEPELTTG